MAPQGYARTPAVRIRSFERIALTGAGPALMGFRGLPEDRGRTVAPLLVLRSRQAVSAAIRYSCPCRGSQTVVHNLASLSLACPFRAHRRSLPANAGRLHPPGLWSPSAHSEPRVRSSRALPHPPPSALSVSHALGGLHPAEPLRACFIPVTLMGFHLQGFDPLEEPYPFRGRYSLVVDDIRQSR